MKKVIVIGGGPSGMMAALQSARNKNQVILLEKNDQLGKKLLLTGNGRCNVTNNSIGQEFLNKVHTNRKFLYSSLSAFSSYDMLDFLEENNIEVKEEDNGRMFPTTNSSFTIRDVFKNLLIQDNVDIHYEEPVQELVIKDNVCLGVKTSKNVYYADEVILATGGKSYPLTGSCGDGYKLVEKYHTIKELQPALAALVIKENWIKELQGLTIKDVTLTYRKKKYKGDILFTHFGISGPMVLNLSSLIRFDKDDTIYIDLFGSEDEQALDARLVKLLQKHANKKIQNVLGLLIPSKMVLPLLKVVDIDAMMECNQLKKQDRMHIIHTLKMMELHIHSLRGFKEAMVTKGGIAVKEVNPNTMESKIIQHLKIVGEILDVDASTGGYNLQIAWSTGYVAGSK